MRKCHVHWQNTSHCISIVIALDTITAYYIWFNRGINRVLINGFYSVCTANTGDRERKNRGTSLTSLLKILFWGKVEKWLFKLFFQNKCLWVASRKTLVPPSRPILCRAHQDGVWIQCCTLSQALGNLSVAVSLWALVQNCHKAWSG